jgi:hypothetical protein
MTYAVIRDIPASWERYAPFAEALADPVPSGLVLHVAGPTDEGFRLVEIWETRDDWERFRAREQELVGGSTLAPMTLRELEGVATIRGRRVRDSMTRRHDNEGG